MWPTRSLLTKPSAKAPLPGGSVGGFAGMGGRTKVKSVRIDGTEGDPGSSVVPEARIGARALGVRATHDVTE